MNQICPDFPYEDPELKEGMGECLKDFFFKQEKYYTQKRMFYKTGLGLHGHHDARISVERIWIKS